MIACRVCVKGAVYQGGTGKYGGDDGAREPERAEIQPGEDTGMTATPIGQAPQKGKRQAERKQDQDLKTGEERPA